MIHIDFRKDLKTIDTYAFNDCENLTTVLLPDTVISIESDAFNWCDNLSTLEIDATVPPAIGRIFGPAVTSLRSNLEIVVPLKSLDAYKNDKGDVHYCAQWSDFSDNIHGKS